MATLYGLQAAKRLSTLPRALALQGQDGGNVKSSYDIYTVAADLASGDVIRLGRVPKGARVIDVRCVFADLDASGGTIDIGWLASAELDSAGSAIEAASAAGFGSNIDVTSAGVYSMFTSGSTLAGYQKVFSAEVEVAVTTDGDTDATSGDIELEILYVID